MTFTDTVDEFDPVVAEDDSGLVHLFYRMSVLGIFYRRSTNGGTTWEPPVLLIPQLYSARPHVTVDDRQNAHVVWRDGRDGNTEIYYKRWMPPSGIDALLGGVPFGDSRHLTTTPNPFTSFATLPGHEAERFVLYDISGKRVGSCKGDRVGEGLAPGVYFLKYQEMLKQVQHDEIVRIVKVR